MNSLFKSNNPVFRILTRIFDLMYLNLLCLLCCIPVITIGASVTALYYCMLKISRDSDSSISKMFFSSFRLNLKQGIIITIILAGCILFLIADIFACDIINLAISKYIKIFLYILLFGFALIASYAFPLLAQFENSIKNILKNSFFMAISNIGYSLIIVILNAIPIILVLFLPELFLFTILLWLTLGFSSIAMINSKMFVIIFNKYIPEYQNL